MKKVYRERLLRLATLLERIKPTEKRHFHLRSWECEQSCGTSVCAIGYAMRHPWFNERGLTASKDSNIPLFQGSGGFRAVRAFFGLEGNIDALLFLAGSYKPQDRSNPRAVAKRIREFVAKPT